MGSQEPQDDHRGHQHDDGPISPRALVGNLGRTGLPWHQVVRHVLTNFGIKVVTLRPCCGNHGKPGC